MNKIEIDNKLFKDNRTRLAAKIKPNSIIVLNSNDIMPSNADGTMQFKQNSDLFYFTGIEQEETIFLMYPDANEKSHKEILFIRDINEDLITWEGSKLRDKEAREISGIETIMPVSRFERLFRELMNDAENIYLNANEHKRSTIQVETRDDRFIKKWKDELPLHNFLRAAPVIFRLREIKSGMEIGFLKKACDLTEKGFRRVLKFISPGVTEYEIEAEFAHEFIRNGSSFADYLPIIASGADSCALHYEKNNKVCNDGDIVLMDTAAMYANYNADMTRTIPVNGKFTKRQKQVYNSVHRVLNETRKLMVKGKMLEQLLNDTEVLIEKELVELGLLNYSQIKKDAEKKELVKKYYPHGVSHFLGLDVHDVGYFYEPLLPGMVLTCEPGIYIKEEGFGIRLENNIVITETGNVDLMESIPIDADEIEEIMNS
jgi:Xaa-Pro aminopeptidase